jgi:hypothetical protein
MLKCELILVYLLLTVGCMRSQDSFLATDFRIFKATPVWPLAQAVQSEDTAAIVNLIRQNEIDVDFQEQKFGMTVLMLAVFHNKYESSKILLELGANPNLHNSHDGSSAIIDAAEYDFIEPRFVTLLLAHGANVNDEEQGERKKGNFQRNSPLLAASASDLDKVKLLLAAGAAVKLQK